MLANLGTTAVNRTLATPYLGSATLLAVFVKRSLMSRSCLLDVYTRNIMGRPWAAMSVLRASHGWAWIVYRERAFGICTEQHRVQYRPPLVSFFFAFLPDQTHPILTLRSRTTDPPIEVALVEFYYGSQGVSEG